MTKKSKIKTHGGARKGSGRPKSGVNTVTISFSVHKDFAEPIKETVRAKIEELKKIKLNPAEIITPTNPSPHKIVKTNTSFLEKRRNAKLGIK